MGQHVVELSDGAGRAGSTFSVAEPWRGAARGASVTCLLNAVVLTVVFRLDAGRDAAALQPKLAFAGTESELRAVTAEGKGAVQDAVTFDCLFALLFGVLGVLLIRAATRSGCVPPYRFGALNRDTDGRLPGWLVLAPAVAGVLDLLENAACLRVGTDGAHLWLAPYITTLSWWKWLAYVAALAVMLTLLYDVAMPHGFIEWAREKLSFFDGWRHVTGHHDPGEMPKPEKAATPSPDTGGTAICVSGGGIRAASVAHGALRGLDEPTSSPGPSIFRSARWLSSVSGGGYTAAGWAVSRHNNFKPAIGPDATATADRLFTDNEDYALAVRSRRQYLYNGRAGLLGGLGNVVVRLVLSLGALALMAGLAGFGEGELLRSYAVCRTPGRKAALDAGCDVWAARTAWVGVVPLGLAVLVLLCSLAFSSEIRRARWQRAGVALAGVGAFLVVVAVGVPAFVTTDRWGDFAKHFFSLKGLPPVLAALVGAVVAVLRSQVSSRLMKSWSRLGGVLLAAALILVMLKAATVRANFVGNRQPLWHFLAFWRDGYFHHFTWLPLVTLIWLAVVGFIPAHRFTLNGVYRLRLAMTFALHRAGNGLAPIPYSKEPLAEHYTDAVDGPHLILCLTQHSSRRQAGGLKAAGLTVERTGVHSYLPSKDPTRVPWAEFPTGSWWSGFPRGWVLTRAMAISGAAFGSAMGRSSLGTTNALLAALNLRTGIWIPNPVRRNDYWPQGQVPTARSPRVGFGYFLKEVFGRYHPERDPFVFVSDGGHRENLGLVDVLPRRPDRIFVIDASGDKAGTFSTLRQAIDLAMLEHGVDIDLNWRSLRVRDGETLPDDCVVAGTVRYPDAPPAPIYYARYQPCTRCPQDVLEFSGHDPSFPIYTLTHQSLSEDQFDHLVKLGEHLAARLKEVLATGQVPFPAAADPP